MFAGKSDGEGIFSPIVLPFLSFSFLLYLFLSLLPVELDRVGGPTEGVSERVLLQELMFAFQGIDGKFIRLSPADDGFRISNEVPSLQAS